MPSIRPLPWLAVVSLTACTVTPQAPAPTPTRKPAATATATPAPSVAPAKLPALPSRVNLVLPGGMGPYLGPGGASLVASGGGNLVASGGGNYGLLACPTPTQNGTDFFADIMGLTLAPYAECVLIVNNILARALAGGLEPETAKVIADPRAEGKSLTVLLSGSAERGLLRVVEGTEFHEANQIMGLAFEGRNRGTAVYSSPVKHPRFGHMAIATRFDLDKGEVSADGLADPTVLPNASDPLLYRAHWEFRAPAQVPAGGAAFTMQLAGHVSLPGDACESGPRGVTAKFLANGQGAVRMGRVLADASSLVFTRRDGTGYDAEIGAGNAFYLGANGAPLAPEKAGEALAALAPTAGEFDDKFPPNPAVGQPFADPVFAFP